MQYVELSFHYLKSTILRKGDKQLCKNFINAAFFLNVDWIEPTNKFEKEIKNEIKELQDFIYDLD